MGVAQPTELPIWATDGGAVRSAPTNDQQDFGYLEGAIPTAEEWNYIFYAHWVWLNWLRNQDQFDYRWIPEPVGAPSAWGAVDGLGTAGLSSTGVGDAMIDLGTVLRHGDVLRTLVLTLEAPNASAELTVYLYKRPVSGAAYTQIATQTFINIPAWPGQADFTNIIVSGVAPEFNSAEPMVLIVAANTSGIKIRHVRATGDRRAA